MKDVQTACGGAQAPRGAGDGVPAERGGFVGTPSRFDAEECEGGCLTAADTLAACSHDELVDFIVGAAKNLIAIDGTWFQSVESTCGMDEAMRHDCVAWRRYTGSEARRVRTFLGLPERCGLEGLAHALPFKLTSLANEVSLRFAPDGALEFRVERCRVQQARMRKGMPLHPCKSAGFEEYDGFARALDDRIVCSCVSCYPDVTDESCACAWRFEMREGGESRG